VLEVKCGPPAEVALLQQGDMITALDRKVVTGAVSSSRSSRELAPGKLSRSVSIAVNSS